MEKFERSILELEFPERKNILCLGISDLEFFEKLKSRNNDITCFIESNYLKDIGKIVDHIQHKDLDSDIISTNKKFDLVILKSLEKFQDIEKILKTTSDLINNNGYAICLIENFCHISMRLKILDGNLKYESDKKITQDISHALSLDSILTLFEKCQYKVVAVNRIKQEFVLSKQKELKFFTTPQELIDCILKDPEALVSQYIFKIEPHNAQSKLSRKELERFPRGIALEALKEKIEYYKTQTQNLHKKIENKDKKIYELETKLDHIKSSIIWKLLRKVDKIRK